MARPSPAMQAVLDRLAEQRTGLPDRYGLPYPAARAQLIAERRPWLDDGPACAWHDERIGREGRRDVGVRVYHPPIDRGAHTLVYLHGGGWCVGSPETHDNIVRRLAVELAAESWSVDYALAPEHPHPAASHDVQAAIGAAAAARPGSRLLVAGDSAGAHLALDAALRLRDAGRSPLAALVLFYGVYTRALDDVSMDAYGDGRFGLSRAAQQRYLGDAFGAMPVSGFDAPRFGLDADVDVAGLPPTLVVAAELDILHDQSLAFATRLDAARVTVELLDVPGVTHGFLSYARALPEAADTLAAACTWVRGLR